MSPCGLTDALAGPGPRCEEGIRLGQGGMARLTTRASGRQGGIEFEDAILSLKHLHVWAVPKQESIHPGGLRHKAILSRLCPLRNRTARVNETHCIA
jgi:hypothetical protein